MAPFSKFWPTLREMTKCFESDVEHLEGLFAVLSFEKASFKEFLMKTIKRQNNRQNGQIFRKKVMLDSYVQ